MPSLSLTRVCVSNSEPALQAHVVEPKWIAAARGLSVGEESNR